MYLFSFWHMLYLQKRPPNSKVFFCNFVKKTKNHDLKGTLTQSEGQLSWRGAPRRSAKEVFKALALISIILACFVSSNKITISATCIYHCNNTCGCYFPLFFIQCRFSLASCHLLVLFPSFFCRKEGSSFPELFFFPLPSSFSIT